MSKWAILGTYVGSIAHGTYRPNTEPNSIDDKDVLFVCVPDESYYFGLKELGSRGTVTVKQDPYDIVAYEARKFVRLLAQGNPNVLCVLWMERKHFVRLEPAGQLLLDARMAFVGKHVYHSFAGYAFGQLHRMEHGALEGYMGAKRKALVEKFHFDTKNASHLIRLLRMCCEFLASGEMIVSRPDAPELLSIKDGAWSLERVKAEADRLFKLAEEAYLHSALPNRPDAEAVSRICIDVVRAALETRHDGQSSSQD